jgi:pimeloyl-ACP methyl ester carboxylesterase
MTEKTPLILLPGLLCDAALWRHQAETLSDLAQPIVVDLTEFDSVSAMARSVLAAAPERFCLAGLSMGGYVALEIMRQAPDRVLRLALVDTAAAADTPEQKARRRGLIDLTEKGEFRGVTDRLLPLLIHHDRLSDLSLTDTVKAMAERVGKDAFKRQQRAIMNRPDGRNDLSLIHCPTVIICGRQDSLTPLAGQVGMAAAIARAKLVVIEECGHLAPLEQPAAVSAVLRYWLQT